ncbi:Poly(A) RNA polymerase cid14 [Zancudomyces culisetae]|uniref:Poly(A) RNA polymerase cid14 n=1 Tax=Zancudomyces culisetae TaxID=1213189 RepID=A0A1R1PV76_ZANCU|nr:Poly(A) RNA polymerase cid14 [Zancudomyces culisetae]|eukprot:OMH84870.1 Poly(A) RNA polymerase cid14 [Zancudomyces culisetae]
MGVLLCEFLELYGKRFNYGNVGIVLTDGGFYIERPKGEENEDPYGKKSQVLYLQDPGDMLNNVTSGTYGISRVRHSFSTAFDLLTGTMYRYFQTKRFGNPITEFEQQNKRHIFFSGNTGRNSNNVTYDLNNPVSFLSSILTVDKKTISTRGFLKNLYHQNVFQNELGLPKKLLKGNGTTNSKNKRTSSAETLHSGSFGSAGTSINKHDYKFSAGSQPDSSPVYISDSE